MKKVTISLAGIMKGKVEKKATKIIIPFSTRNTKISKRIPRVGSLIFELSISGGKLEYKFSGVDLKCYCQECKGK